MLPYLPFGVVLPCLLCLYILICCSSWFCVTPIWSIIYSCCSSLYNRIFCSCFSLFNSVSTRFYWSLSIPFITSFASVISISSLWFFSLAFSRLVAPVLSWALTSYRSVPSFSGVTSPRFDFCLWAFVFFAEFSCSWTSLLITILFIDDASSVSSSNWASRAFWASSLYCPNLTA